MIKFAVTGLMIINLCIGEIIAQEQSNYVLGRNVTLNSEILGEDCSLSIYLPDGYDKMNLKYPLLIVLDGYFLWPTGIVDFLSFSGNIPQMIVVSLSTKDRDRDFTPTNSKNLEGEYVPNSGGANNFIKFLEKELIPFIEENYRTEPYRILSGHSLGGLLTTYVMLEKSELFQAYFAISPTLPWDNEWVVKQVESKLKSKYSDNIFYSLAMDSQEGSMLEAAKNFVGQLEKQKPENLEWKFERYIKEDHISCFLIGLYDALRALYSSYKIPETLIEKGDAVGIEKHYCDLTKKYNYTIIPSWEWIDWIANWHQLMNRFDEAISLYELATKYYPNVSHVHARLGFAYEAGKLYLKAISSYETALQFSSDETEIGIISDNIKRLELIVKRQPYSQVANPQELISALPDYSAN